MNDRLNIGVVGLGLALLVAGVCVARLAVAEPVTTDQWYVVLIGDQRVGWMHTQVNQGPDQGPIETSAQTRITVRRGRLDMTIGIQTRFLETADGQPIEAHSDQTLGKMSTTQAMYFGEDSVEVVTRQGDAEQSRRAHPLPVVGPVGPDGAMGWLPPAAAQRYIQDKITGGADQIRFWTLDPSMGLQPVGLWMARGEPQDVRVYGRLVHATVWDTTMSVMPGITNREYLDDQGQRVKSRLAVIPGMAFTVVAADRELALSPTEPPELMAATLIQPDRPIDRPRQATSGVYELLIGVEGGSDPNKRETNQQGQMSIRIPQSRVQRVRAIAPDRFRVEVRMDGPDIDQQDPPPDERYLTDSVVLGSSDPAVRDLTTRALAAKEGMSNASRAEALRRFVHGFIQEKDLSVGFATASEVARTAQGDCTEHAVLLAAMLRASGIPSRTVSGLIYVDRFMGRAGVFAYHMWAQAWIHDTDGTVRAEQGGRWVDLDATLGETAFDATHIALGTSAMADGSVVNDMVRMVPLIGRLGIRVIRVEGNDPRDLQD